MLTRRRFFVLSSVTGILSFGFRSNENIAFAAQDDSSKVKSVGDILQVTQAGNELFESKMTEHFEGLLEDPGFKQIRSHSALVENLSDEDVNAFSTRWTITTKTGGYDGAIHHYFHPDPNSKPMVRYGCRGDQTRFTGQVAALKAGQIRLVTPYFCWSPSYYQDHSQQDWYYHLSRSESSKFFFYELSRASGIEVSVDAAVIKQHAVLGTDFGRLGRIYKISRNAEHDEAASTGKMLSSHASDDKLESALEAHRDGVFQPRELPANMVPTKNRDYLHIRSRQARVLLKHYHTHGRKRLNQTVRYLVHQQKTKLG